MKKIIVGLLAVILVFAAIDLRKANATMPELYTTSLFSDPTACRNCNRIATANTWETLATLEITSNPDKPINKET